MSDTQGGPDWYLASDGKWYPPQPTQAPVSPPAPGGYQAPPGTAYEPPTPGAYGAPPQAPQNGMATASMILGIIALVTFWFCGLGFLVGVIAVVLGILGMSAAKKLPGQPLLGRAKAGVIMGGIAIVLGLAAFIFLIVLGNISSDDNDFQINTDTPNGVCDESRFLQDPDC
jgi:hypothetical protein